MKALQKAEKGGDLALEPLPAGKEAAQPEPEPRTPAQRQAASVFEATAPPRRSLVIPIALLALVVLGGGGAAYVYFATRPTSLLATPKPLPPGALIPAPPAAPAPAGAPPTGPAADMPVTPPAASPPAAGAAPALLAVAPPEAAASPAGEPTTEAPPATKAKPAAPPKPRAKPSARAKPKPAPAEPEAAPEESTMIASEPGEAIRISRAPRQLAVNPSVMAGYAAIEAGRYGDAESAYRQALSDEPRNVDAMLGMAAALVGQGRAEEASRHYVAVLQLEPRNSVAQAGLIAILGALNPEGAEQRLKLLAAADPSPFLDFTLGNLHAARERWDEARRHYAEAVRGEPDNAEYTYNLAVSLDHLRQHRPALDHYRKALELAAARPGSAIDPVRVGARIAELERAPE